MSQQLIIILIIELIIFAFFDTRKSGFNQFINTAALIGATYFTFNEYGWSFMLLVPTLGALIVGGLIGGTIMGFILKSQGRSEPQEEARK